MSHRSPGTFSCCEPLIDSFISPAICNSLSLPPLEGQIAPRAAFIKWRMHRCGRGRRPETWVHLLVAVEKVGAGGVVFAGLWQAFINFLLAEPALPPGVTNALITLENNEDHKRRCHRKSAEMLLAQIWGGLHVLRSCRETKARHFLDFGWLKLSFFWRIVSSTNSHSEHSSFLWKSADVNTHLLETEFLTPSSFQIYWVSCAFMGHEIVYLSLTNESDFSTVQRGIWFIHLAPIGPSHFHLFPTSIKSSMWRPCPFFIQDCFW